MATQIKNTLSFDLAPGAQVVLPHKLNNGTIPVAADIIFIPSPQLEVLSPNDLSITLRNTGPSPLTGSVLVEWWHTVERAFGDAADLDLPVKPVIVVSAEIANAPPQPAFQDPPLEIFIYARLAGNDVTGNGTLANPYRTFERAIRDVPNFIPPGVYYVVDITGIGVETLPDDFVLPSWKSTVASFGYDLSVFPFTTVGAVRIRALPQPASALSPANQVINVGVDSFNGANILTITDATKTWPAGGLVGLFAVGSGEGEKGAINANTPTSIEIAADFPFTYPVTIMELSATLEGKATYLGGPGAGIQAGNQDSLTWQGIQIRPSAAAIIDPGPFARSILCTGGTPIFDMCDVINPEVNDTDQDNGSEFICCNIVDPVFRRSGVNANVCRIFGGFNGGEFGSDEFSTFGGLIVDSCNPLGALSGVFVFGGYIKNALSDGLAGGFIVVMGTGQIDSSVGNAVFTDGNRFVLLFGVVGGAVGFENGGVGVRVDSGAQVLADVATTVTGVGGDIEVGNLGAAVYPGAGGNVPDFAGATATGARLFTP